MLRIALILILMQGAVVLTAKAQDVVNQDNEDNSASDTTIAASDNFAIDRPARTLTVAEYIKGFSIKSNVLLFFTMVTNIEVERNVGKQWSLCVPFMYSPYTVTPYWAFRLLALQPEWRWWIQEQQDGWFLGIHAHTGYFNIAWNAKDRYQTRNGSKGMPFYGIGVGVGYAMMTDDHWFAEFEIGFGYAHFEYDIFDNHIDAARGKHLGYGIRNYWGITRASIGIGYKW